MITLIIAALMSLAPDAQASTSIEDQCHALTMDINNDRATDATHAEYAKLNCNEIF